MTRAFEPPHGSDSGILAIHRWITTAPRVGPGGKPVMTLPTTTRRPAVRILSCSQLTGIHWTTVFPLKMSSLPRLNSTPSSPLLHTHLYLGMAGPGVLVFGE